MKARLQRFMLGRYGQDDLGRMMSIAALVLCVVSLFTGWMVVYALALVLLGYSVYRMMSRKTERRRDENLAWLRLQGRFTGFFTGIGRRVKQSKTHRFYKCPGCGQQLRVPKGRGRIMVNCPKCGNAFEKKT